MTEPGEQSTPIEPDQPWWQAGQAPERDFGTAPLPDRDTDSEAVEPDGTRQLSSSSVPMLTDSEAVEPDGTRQLSSSSVPMLMAVRSQRELAAAVQRDVGRIREMNQDSVFALITSLPRESRNVPMGLFVVADGMGGHDGGEIASRMAVRRVTHYVLEHLLLPALDDSVTEALQPLVVAAVQEANFEIFTHARSINSDMGTTCSLALLLGGAFYIAHVGDSRIYLRTPGQLQQITDDHSAVGRLIQLGQITPEEARDHPRRSQLYRTVGQQPQVPVDFIYQPINDATHLLLCSDGLWSMIDDNEIDEVLEQSLWPQNACQELIARANLAGGEDNISAVVVTLPAARGSSS